MNLVIVGCGYVADFYMTTLPNHPELQLVGIFDRNPEAASRFSRYYNVRAFETLEAMLNEAGAELVLNLTNPASHYQVSLACLGAGKHVFSEKPLATKLSEAQHLVEVARDSGLSLSCAPSSMLDAAASAVRRSLESGAIGTPLLAYAEMEDSMVFRADYRNWISASGAPWPAHDEFASGCVVEHGGYYLTWLCSFFGPVVSLTAYAQKIFPDKGTGQAIDELANDFAVACCTFANGTVARLTCGLVAAQNRSLTIIGSTATLKVRDGWDYRSPIHLHSTTKPISRWNLIGRMSRKWLGYSSEWRRGARQKYEHTKKKVPEAPSRMDFMLGPSKMAEAIATGTELRMSAELALHVTELVLAIQNADTTPMPYNPLTRFS